MNLIEAIILGIVQGLTEFIPVSSSGHLVLSQYLFAGKADHLFIQALDFGTLAALIIYFMPRLIKLFKDVFFEKDYRLARNIIITCIPAGLLGLLLADFIQSSAVLLSPLVVALMVALVGVLMIVVDKIPNISVVVAVLSISSCAFGVRSPIPTFPEFCCTTNCDVPTASPPVEMVEVATVDVALKFPKVGVEVAVTTPLALVESKELIESPVRVSDGVEIEDVAVNVEARTSPPVNTPEPPTESVRYGEVVPMPTLPLVGIN